MLSRLCPLGLSLLLCLPALAEAPKPAPPAATYHWHKLAVSHTSPLAVLTALHWNTSSAPLPGGVERVYAMQRDKTLLLKATDTGLAEATRLVQTVDK